MERDKQANPGESGHAAEIFCHGSSASDDGRFFGNGIGRRLGKEQHRQLPWHWEDGRRRRYLKFCLRSRGMPGAKKADLGFSKAMAGLLYGKFKSHGEGEGNGNDFAIGQ